MKKGLLVTFEGIDGCGKTTQSRIFRDALKSAGFPIVFIKEPGGTETGELIRKILLDGDLPIVPWAELLLYVASRAQLAEEVILPALQRGEVVVCDRYADSTVAYQCYGRGLPQKIVDLLHRKIIVRAKPSLTFLIDADPADLVPILEGKRKDRIEREEISFQQDVRKGYLAIARREKRIRVIRRGTVTATAAEILDQWRQFFHEPRRSKTFS